MNSCDVAALVVCGVTSAVEDNVVMVGAERRVVVRALGFEEGAAETLFLKRIHAGDSEENNRDVCRQET